MTDALAPDTDEMLRLCIQGDPAAPAALLEAHRGRLRQLIAVRLDRRVAPRVDPSDVVQDALHAASRQLPNYLSARPLPFYPWLRRIACDRLADVHRRHIGAKKRSVRREEPLYLTDESAMSLAHQLIVAESSNLGKMIRQEQFERVRTALEKLKPNDREVLILRHLEDLDTRDAAAVLGISESAVKLRHLRAIERLQRLLGKNVRPQKTDEGSQ